jgi:hypothetical protein
VTTGGSFHPAKLSKEALEAPLPGRLARLAPAEAEHIREERVEQYRRLKPLGKLTRRRLLRGGLGGGLLCAVGGWLFAVSSLQAFLMFFVLGGIVGALAAAFAWGTSLTGFAFGSVGLVVSFATIGHDALFKPAGLLKVLVVGLLGALFAIGEALWRSDGD